MIPGFLVLGSNIGAFGQSRVSGTVRNAQQEPVTEAIISLQRQQDSAVIMNTVPDSLGRYNLVYPDTGVQQLVVSAMGYRTAAKTVPSDTAAPVLDFVLDARATNLDEVQVSSTKPLFERRPDRLIYNVSSAITATGSNALEILRRAPGVIVSQKDYAINLLGKSGVLILVDDRLLQLSGEDLFAWLQAMPAANIDRVEVITMPPAKYDAAGNSGVLSIVLKRNNEQGLNGSIRAGFEQASFGKGIAGGELNYRKGGINLYGTLNYSNGTNQIVERLNTPYPGQAFEVTDDYKRILKPLQYAAGVDFDMHKRGVLGLQWMSANANRRDASTDKILVRKMPAATIDSTMITLGRATRNSSNNTLNLNYTWKIDTSGKTLTLNANRLWFNGSRTNDFNTTNYLGDGISPSGVFSHKAAHGRQDITISTVQADVQLPYSFASLSVGGKLGFINNNSDNRFGYFDQDGYHDDPTVSNGFAYQEKVQALYASAEKTIGKWSLQAGLRGEFTQTTGYAVSLGSTATNRYFNLFPTAYIQYQPSEANSWNLNYSKRINRPDYRSLDPFRAYATPYHYSQGNPFLLPSFNHNLEISYAYQGRYSLSAFYQYERNHFGSVWMVDEARNITSGISLNFADFISCGINAMASWQPFTWWETQVQLGMQQQQLQSAAYAGVEQSYKKLSVYLGGNNSFVLNRQKTLMAEFNFFYSSPYREDFLEIKGMGGADAGFRYLVLDKRLSFSLNAGDIFATQKPRGVHVVTGQSINNYFDTRNLRLTVQYRFGNKELKARRERRSGIEEEKGRAG